MKVKKEGERNMASRNTFECYRCRGNGFPETRVYLDGKTEDGKTIYKNPDMSPHSHKQGGPQQQQNDSINNNNSNTNGTMVGTELVLFQINQLSKQLSRGTRVVGTRRTTDKEMTYKTTFSMVVARARWISELSSVQLEVSRSAEGITVFSVDTTNNNRILKELFFTQNLHCAFTCLRAIYEFLGIIKQNELTQEQKEQGASGSSESRYRGDRRVTKHRSRFEIWYSILGPSDRGVKT